MAAAQPETSAITAMPAIENRALMIVTVFGVRPIR